MGLARVEFAPCTLTVPLARLGDIITQRSGGRDAGCKPYRCCWYFPPGCSVEPCPACWRSHGRRILRPRFFGAFFRSEWYLAFVFPVRFRTSSHRPAARISEVAQAHFSLYGFSRSGQTASSADCWHPSTCAALSTTAISQRLFRSRLLFRFRLRFRSAIVLRSCLWIQKVLSIFWADLWFPG